MGHLILAICLKVRSWKCLPENCWRNSAMQSRTSVAPMPINCLRIPPVSAGRPHGENRKIQTHGIHRQNQTNLPNHNGRSNAALPEEALHQLVENRDHGARSSPHAGRYARRLIKLMVSYEKISARPWLEIDRTTFGSHIWHQQTGQEIAPIGRLKYGTDCTQV